MNFCSFGLINNSFYAMVLECVRSTNEGFLEYWLTSSNKVK